MNEIVKHMQREIIKKIMKRAIDNNPLLNSFQKDERKARVDTCAVQADRIVNMLSTIKYQGL